MLRRLSSLHLKFGHFSESLLPDIIHLLERKWAGSTITLAFASQALSHPFPKATLEEPPEVTERRRIADVHRILPTIPVRKVFYRSKIVEAAGPFLVF